MSTVTLNNAKGAGDFLRLRFWGTVLLMLGALLALGAGSAFAAAPLAGTSIGNQASASYTDANSVARLTVSNSVSTVVTAVHSAALTQSQSKVVAPGQTFAFPHTIVNNGNAPDTYTLTLGSPVTGSANLSAQPLFYADTNCDGVADGTTATTSIGPIAAGGQSCFVAQGTAGTTAATTASFAITLAGSGTITGTNPNIDDITISANAVISVTKSISVSTGPSGTFVTYTLTYRNTGTVSAGNVVIADTLPSNAAYVPGSATWSGFATALTDLETDLQGSAPYRIDYGLVGTATNGGSVYAILERVDPGVQGTIEFRAQMIGSGPLTIENRANWCYSDIGTGGTIVPAATGTLASGTCFNVRSSFGAGTVTLTDLTQAVSGITNAASTARTNVVPFFIPSGSAATGAVVYKNTTATSADATSGEPYAVIGDITTPTLPDTSSSVATKGAVQGAMVTWDTVVWNTGTSTDTYNITRHAVAALNNFPAGTTFLLLRSDGFTPLTDSNNDGIVDTGPVPATTNNSYTVRVVALLPPSGIAGTYSAAFTATSTNVGTPSNSVVVRVTVANSTVDLLNTGVLGAGQTAAGEPAGAVTTVSANPASNAVFVLRVSNTGGVADSYNLSFNMVAGTAHVATAGAYTTVAAFSNPSPLPSGFDVKFYRDNGTGCTSLGAEASNTGVIQPGVIANFCAQVAVPAGAAAGSYQIYFRVISPTTWESGNFTTSSADVKRDQLTINSVRTVAISPNNSGQGFPGGSVQYCHTVTNSGNTNESGLTVTQAPQSLASTSGWATNATVYFDANSNCILDGTETASPQTTTLTLGTVTAGASVKFIVVVQVPGAAAAGQTNVNTFTLNGGGATVTQATATDTTTVVLGQISLVKDQLADAACTTTFDAATLDPLTTFSQAQLSAAPNTCIIYRVRATNVGTQPVTAVVLNDVAPPNTTLHAAAVSGATNPCTPGGTSPNVTCSLSPLNGGATSTMYFRVRINN